MQITFGYNAQERRAGRVIPVAFVPEQTINPHVLIMGDSGAGKTTLMRRAILELVVSARKTPRIHVFDTHGDVHIPDASDVVFSEATGYGLNPLHVNPDPHFGGIRRAVNGFISTINRTTHKLGVKQEACLRALFVDLYARWGMHADDPGSWTPRSEPRPSITEGRIYLDVPVNEQRLAIDAGCAIDPETQCLYITEHSGLTRRWPVKQFGRRFPTLSDLVRFAEARTHAVFLGSSETAMSALEEVNKAARANHRFLVACAKAGQRPTDDANQQQRMELIEEAVAAYQHYLTEVVTGVELEDLLKYSSLDVMRSVVDRLRMLLSTGIFGSALPPFDPAVPVWRYDIRPLSDQEKKLLVDFRLSQIFTLAIQRGETDQIRDVLVVDEAKLYTSDDPDHILNRIAREGRKFGLMLMLAAQSPTHFSEDLLTQMATKVILGLDKAHWAGSQRRLGVDQQALGWIRPRERALVMSKGVGTTSTSAYYVDLPRQAGQQAAIA